MTLSLRHYCPFLIRFCLLLFTFYFSVFLASSCSKRLISTSFSCLFTSCSHGAIFPIPTASTHLSSNEFQVVFKLPCPYSQDLASRAHDPYSDTGPLLRRALIWEFILCGYHIQILKNVIFYFEFVFCKSISLLVLP